jgi:hypothetical protein
MTAAAQALRYRVLDVFGFARGVLAVAGAVVGMIAFVALTVCFTPMVIAFHTLRALSLSTPHRPLATGSGHAGTRAVPRSRAHRQVDGRVP